MTQTPGFINAQVSFELSDLEVKWRRDAWMQKYWMKNKYINMQSYKFNMIISTASLNIQINEVCLRGFSFLS